ncbi:MAG TPA: hypothetical protein VM425_10895 [Myxococcota bacterium]|nr:hypothetical protein [Myxococcota bacterium]
MHAAKLVFLFVFSCLILTPGESTGRVGGKMFLDQKDIMGVIGQMHARFGAGEKERFERGVRQAAALWEARDGNPAEFAKFCLTQFMTGKDLDALFTRYENKLEQLDGHMTALDLQLKHEMHEDTGPLVPVDRLFAAFAPGAHLSEDLFAGKLAFTALLNFPVRSLDDMLRDGGKWSRRQWAEARLCARFTHRVPAGVNQALAAADSAGSTYIAGYNICMDHVVGKNGKPLFRKGLKLISHWGLRDELKAEYADAVGNLPRQEMIYVIMQRIISQQIPAAVIDNPAPDWDPVANTVDGKRAEREADRRYEHFLDAFHAQRLLDPYYPEAPTAIERAFKIEREIPEKRIVDLLESVLDAPVGAKMAKMIEKRLGRKLRPFDIWYDGFKARAGIDEQQLDKLVKGRFPDVAAFQKGIPAILAALGFDKKTAAFLAAKIEIDPARGAGHALGPMMRTEKAHLRTRVPAGGMNYKGFNIGMHEMGHNVEQIFSLYRVDHTLVAGVPNNAFTEGFAFVFQARDLQVLGKANSDERTEALKVLDTFWSTREIAGVALVDLGVWHWMYAHPEAKAAELRQAVVGIAKDVWNKHYAPLFGEKDSPILAVYSHMISYPLYLAHYPLGLIIAFQVENYFKTHKLAAEMVRMCIQGNILPDLWMKKAVGKPISAQPLIRAAAAAIKKIR